MLKVPLTLAGLREGASKGSTETCQPCLVTVYGAYGVSLKTDFRPNYISLLSNGWILAFAHVRGGGELGREWHHLGRTHGKLRALQVCSTSPHHQEMFFHWILASIGQSLRTGMQVRGGSPIV